MKKQTKQKFKNIWNRIKKPLMIFSFIFNIIFLIFIVVGCVGQKKQVKSTNTIETQEVSENTDTIEEDGVIYHRSQNREVTSLADTYWRFNETLTFNTISFGAYLDFSVGNEEFQFWAIEPTSRPNTLNGGKIVNYPYVAQTITLYQNGAWVDSSYRDLHITSDSQVQYIRDFLSVNAVQQDPPSPEPEPVDYEPVTEIYLGDGFIPSVYVTENGQFILNGYAGYHSGSDTFALILDGFTFVSNGVTFNKITLLYGSLNATNAYVTTDGATLTDVTTMSNYMCCIAVKYAFVNEENVTERNITVATMRKTLVTDNNMTLNVTDVRPPFIVWVNDAYRTLTITEDTQSIISGSYLTIENMSAVQLLQVTSNASTSAVGLSDVNSLLKGAFSALSSIFGLTILPGLTIGLLLFLPLVVTILVAVIRLIRK